ncbi:unnamed protein product [Soboliphyme baturini]|uniref:Uncharacterized protein n=1 Tax=Soboliphyme baturini TaxID=241478 RepID=A0A183II96_9BILA|nr:unnamed protein product [Soboliphyme baturini]
MDGLHELRREKTVLPAEAGVGQARDSALVQRSEVMVSRSRRYRCQWSSTLLYAALFPAPIADTVIKCLSLAESSKRGGGDGDGG